MEADAPASTTEGTQGTPTAPASPPAPSDHRVNARYACLNCGYDLFGLDRDGVCSECATPVRLSIERSLLEACPTPTLHRIGRGASLLLFSVVLMVVAIGSAVAMANLPRGFPEQEIILATTSTLTALAAFVVYSIGWVFVARAATRRVVVERERFSERDHLVRHVCVGGAIAMTVLLIVGTVALVSGTDNQQAFTVLGYPLALASAGHLLMIAPLAGRILGAIPQAPMRKFTSTLKWLTFLIHGLVGLPLVVILLTAILAENEGVIGLGFAYLWMVPVYAAWTLLYVIYLVMFATKVRAEVRRVRTARGATA